MHRSIRQVRWLMSVSHSVFSWWRTYGHGSFGLLLSWAALKSFLFPVIYINTDIPFYSSRGFWPSCRCTVCYKSGKRQRFCKEIPAEFSWFQLRMENLYYSGNYFWRQYIYCLVFPGIAWWKTISNVISFHLGLYPLPVIHDLSWWRSGRIWLEGLCSPCSWKQIRNMVRKYNFRDHLGLLAYPIMVHNRKYEWVMIKLM